MSDLTKYIICFEFLGDNFFGTQKQPDKRTVQNELEKALCTLTKEKVDTVFSGRCDAKVSAKFQVAHFVVTCKIQNVDDFKYHLNCILPDDITVFEIKEADISFHAQKDAKFKHYRYTIQNNRVASVFCKNSLLFPYCELDTERLNQSLSHLIGYHDFGAFKTKSDNPYDDCEIFYAQAKKVKKDWQTFIFIDIIGNRFLYNMVRTIVGQLLLIEKNKMPTQQMAKVLQSKDRQQAADVVSATGLSLEYVGYDDVNRYIEQIIS